MKILNYGLEIQGMLWWAAHKPEPVVLTETSWIRRYNYWNKNQDRRKWGVPKILVHQLTLFIRVGVNYAHHLIKVWILEQVISERWASDQLNTFLLLHPANPPKSEDKYVKKVFNWSEVHLSKMTCYKIYTLEQNFWFFFSYSGQCDDFIFSFWNYLTFSPCNFSMENLGFLFLS